MAKKGNKGEANKLNNIQTCVLKVNIHCDGCQKKVKKLLQKIDGVYTTDIVADQGKVTVVGCVDSGTLLKKLNKAGKHAVEWPTKGGGNQKNLTNQFQKLQLDHPKDLFLKDNIKPQKDKDKQNKHQKLEQESQGNKALKDMLPNLKDIKFPFKKDQKSVKFDMHQEDMGSEFSDEDDDEFDDDEDDFDFDGSDAEDDDVLDDPKITKGMKDAGLFSGKKGSKKGGQVQVSKGGKNGDGFDIKKKLNNNGHDGKKEGGKNEGMKLNNLGQGMNLGNMNQMGQFSAVQGLPAGGMGQFPAAQGLPATANGGAYYNYNDNFNPYQQQQQRMMMPMGYGYGYGHGRPMYAPHNSYSMFSDEDPNACSIM